MESNWYDAKKNPPKHTNDVLITDGHGSFVVAYYNYVWNLSFELVRVDGDGRPILAQDDMIKWQEITPL